MKNFKNWITTSAGFLVLVFGGIAVWFDKIPWFALGVFLIIFYLLVTAKDPKWAKQILKGALGKFSEDIEEGPQEYDEDIG